MTTYAPLSPSDLSLPSRFTEFRPGQWPAISQTSTLPHRFIAQSGPTGFGKSLYAVACAKLEGGRAVYLTSTKALQDQLNRDFAECGMYDMRGRQNYRCLNYDNCSDGRLYGCEAKDQCPAGIARKIFLGSELSDTNYAYYLSSMIHGEGVGPITLLIMDEAHAAVQELADAIEIHLPHERYQVLYRHFGSFPPFADSTLEIYRAWAKSLVEPVSKYKEKLKDGDSKLLALVTHFHALLTQISGTPLDWILDQSNPSETVIAPLWPTDYASRYLFPETVKRVLLVSATIVPKTLQLLGIAPEESIFLEQDHTFDPSRSPVYLAGPIRVAYNNEPGEMLQWVGKMDGIIGRRLDRKGIIHCHSYDRQQYIVQNSDFARYMIVPRKSGELRDALKQFKGAPPPAILVSPSVTTGYDFPGSACEYQIIGKVPFIDKRGPIMSARDKSDPEYLPYLTAQTIVQTCGRGMRSHSDQCENFLLDQHFNWFTGESRGKRKGYRHLFPPWFINQLRYADGFPTPPPPMYSPAGA